MPECLYKRRLIKKHFYVRDGLNDLDIYEPGVYKLSHIEEPWIGGGYIGSTSVRLREGLSRTSCGFHGRFWQHYHLLVAGNHHSVKMQEVVNKYGLDGLRMHLFEVILDRETCLAWEGFYLNSNGGEWNTDMTPLKRYPRFLPPESVDLRTYRIRDYE